MLSASKKAVAAKAQEAAQYPRDLTGVIVTWLLQSNLEGNKGVKSLGMLFIKALCEVDALLDLVDKKFKF
jgi:hypothetical protein